MSDIRTDPEVLRVFQAMGGVTLMEPKGQRIYMSIGDLAFWMRDKCDANEYRRKLFQLQPPIRSASMATAEEMIQAAVKAWSSKAATAAGYTNSA